MAPKEVAFAKKGIDPLPLNLRSRQKSQVTSLLPLSKPTEIFFALRLAPSANNSFF